MLSKEDEALLERTLELAERGRGTTHPNPVVGALVVRDGAVLTEGWHERAGGPHAEVAALAQLDRDVRGATLYVSLEPCNAPGRTPACVDAVLAAGVSRVVVAALDPNPGQGGGLERLRAAGVDVAVAEGELGFRARAQNEAWRTWVAHGRPFVTYKAAVTLDGRVTVPGERWVSGKASRRLVHELRAACDAVAVGMGTFRADAPRLDARDVEAVRQPRRLVFGRGPLPPETELELVPEPLPEGLSRLAREGVQSLLLEGGPTLAAAFLEADLVDRLFVFVAPTLAGAGPGLLAGLSAPRRLLRFACRAVGDDVLLSAYVHEP